MKRYIKAAIDSSFPGWVNNLPLDRISKEFDLYRGEYIPDSIPTSNRDKRLKDPDRLNLFLIHSADYRGDYELRPFAYNEALGGWIPEPPSTFDRSSYRNIPMPWKEIIDRTSEFGYIDAKENAAELQGLRDERKDLKEGAIALQRGVGRLTDKSGYPYLNRERYRRILAKGKLNNIAKLISDQTQQISQLKIEVAKAVLDIDSGRFIVDDWRTESYIDGALQNLTSLVNYRNELNQLVARMENLQAMVDSGEMTQEQYDMRIEYSILEELKINLENSKVRLNDIYKYLDKLYGSN